MGYRDSDDSDFSRHGMGREYDESQSYSPSQGRYAERSHPQDYRADETGSGYRSGQNDRTDRYGQFGMVRDVGPYRGDGRGQGNFYSGRDGGGYGAQGRQWDQSGPFGRQDARAFQDRWGGVDDGRTGAYRDHADGENGFGFMRQSHGVQRNQTQRDPDYHQWREEQLRMLDDDYDSWRKERYQKFSDEFNSWRSTRTGGAAGQQSGQNQWGGASTSASGSTGSGSATKSKDSN